MASPPPQGPFDNMPPNPFLFPFGLSFEPPHYENLSRLVNALTHLLVTGNLAVTGENNDKKTQKKCHEIIDVVLMGLVDYYDNLTKGTAKTPVQIITGVDFSKGVVKDKSPPPEPFPPSPKI